MIRRPRTPFWTLNTHRIPVLSLYKTLLKIARRFDEDVHKRYLYFSLRDSFRSRRHETSLYKTIDYLKEADEVWLASDCMLEGKRTRMSYSMACLSFVVV